MGQPAVDAGWEGSTRFVRSGGEPTRAARHRLLFARGTKRWRSCARGRRDAPSATWSRSLRESVTPGYATTVGAREQVRASRLDATFSRGGENNATHPEADAFDEKRLLGVFLTAFQ